MKRLPIKYLIRAMHAAFGMDYRFYLAAVLAFVLCIILYKGRAYKRIIAGLLAAYAVILLSSTVFSRSMNHDAVFHFELFWTYKVIAGGGWRAKQLGVQIFVNIAMMVPFGCCLPIYIRRNRFLRTIICGCLISVMIELLQLILGCGLPELDDVVHNTFGVVVGFGIYKGVCGVLKMMTALLKNPKGSY